ncbi:magnesium/cobalt transporter CorA [Propionibacteriaceae bacterium Y1700]|uniref:magnesium/cobalt transporter CorA n=1 Tax=Microlunatus sp. Y1700 TaxID=3418487 RepID=UPI003DA729A6
MTTPGSVIDWGWYVDGVRQDCDDVDRASSRAAAGEGFVWMGLKDPSDADLSRFAEQFGLHPLAIEDAVEGHRRSKLEQFGDTLFMVLSTIAWIDHEAVTETSEIVSTGQMMIFLGTNFVLTVRRGEHSALHSLREQLTSDPARLALGPWTVLYAIADKVIDDYTDVAYEIGEDVDEVEELTFSRSGSGGVDSTYQLKRELIEFKRSVVPLGLPLHALANRDHAAVPEDARAYFRELADHHVEVREMVQSYDEVLSSILQAGLARVSVTDNEDMRKISAWVAIVAAPTFIAGVYGMNFDNMPELHWKYGYFIVMGLIFALMVGLYIGFKRKKWL